MRTRLYRRTHAASWLAIPLYALSACNTDAPAGPDASGDLLPGRDYIHVRPLDAQDLQRVAGRAIRALAEARFPGNVPNDVAASQTDTREYGAFTHVHLDYNYADIVSHHWASGASFINLQGSMFGAFRRGSMLPVTVSDGCFSIFSSVCTMGDATDDIDCYGPDGAAAAADGTHFWRWTNYPNTDALTQDHHHCWPTGSGGPGGTSYEDDYRRNEAGERCWYVYIFKNDVLVDVVDLCHY
jgi:hypothetical protein